MSLNKIQSTCHNALTLIMGITSITSLIACDDVADVLKEDPQRSECRAYCEWAAGCHADARDVDREALIEQCVIDTQAVSSTCAMAETEGVDLASSRLISECVDSIDARANEGDCAPFTGDAVEINSATPPVICADLNIFNTARTSTAESNDELCERVSETLCTQTTSCLESYFNIPSDVLGMIDPAPQAQCVTRFNEDVTSSCRDENLYALNQESSSEGKADEPSSTSDIPPVLFSVNPSRETARECLAQLAMISCEELFSGMLPPVCAGAFSDPTVTAGAITGFACGLERDEVAAICD